MTEKLAITLVKIIQIRWKTSIFQSVCANNGEPGTTCANALVFISALRICSETQYFSTSLPCFGSCIRAELVV
ncbi:hypothetical protein TcWFU_003513 [Taenia crassiceps]|uniref:Uncharacterized protein n=1 Tax=Taenia crassiceps TaxID=6207 RepID=A0ABR4Q4I1_9CEST